MARKAGHKDVIDAGGGVLGVSRFGMNINAETPDTTVMGAVTKTFIPGVTSFTFEADGKGASPAIAETYDAGSGAVYGFDIDASAEAIDASSFEETEVEGLPYKVFVAGLPEWTANLQLRYDTDDAIPEIGAEHTVGGAAGIVSNVNVVGEVDGLIEVMLTVKGKAALPAAVNAAGTTIAFSVADDGGQLYAGNAIVTSMRVSGQSGGLIEYSMNSQGTGQLVVGAGGS